MYLLNTKTTQNGPEIFLIAVRKARMGLDPPTGCSFGSVKAPVINMESARLQLSKVQRSVLSGWHALRRVRFVLHKPAEGSLSKKSLAYVQASSQYLKQVSGLLKVGVVTTLRNSASSYEPAQGMILGMKLYLIIFLSLSTITHFIHVVNVLYNFDHIFSCNILENH